MTAELSRQKSSRFLIVLAGIVLGQAILFGPSLIGQKILLPLDILARPGVYIPQTPGREAAQPLDRTLSDLVMQFEPDRRFAAREIKAGRFPFWIPNQYGGVPFIWPKYSPFFLPTALTESPIVLAWAQMLAALVSGIGAYFFCRTVLKVSFWPAAFVAWCYPLTGFFVFWQGYPTCSAVYWLPWLLLTVDRTVRSPGMFNLAGLSLVTGLTLVSGHIDVAGQVLLVSGLYALWCLWDAHRGELLRVAVIKPILFLTLGWSLGMTLAAPHVWPLLEYAKTGYRISQRAEGTEERPPTGLSALPQLVLPDIYGSAERKSILIGKDPLNLQESVAAGYAGLLAILLVAPFAWFSRRHRSINIFWVFLSIFGMSWCLNLPGFVQLLSLPGMRMMSHNRLVFATAFAILAMTAVGLEALRAGQVEWRKPLWIPLGLTGLLLIWTLWSAVSPPEPIATQMAEKIRSGQTFIWIRTLDHVRELQAWFTRHYLASAAWCCLGLFGWLAIQSRRIEHRILLPALGVLMMCDLLWFAWNRRPQCDRDLYFPEVPALNEISKATPGRVIGYSCLSAKLAQAINLMDPRGYDSVDPARWIALLKSTADEHSLFAPYAAVQNLIPRMSVAPPESILLSPILSMLNVRYVVIRGAAREGLQPMFQSPDYWVLENKSALPRAYVPSHVELVTNEDTMLVKLGGSEFDPRAVAYVETPVEFPEQIQGEATIVRENPAEIQISAQMNTPGLLVLSDYWEKGWRAYVNGKATPILRVNYALRGVTLPAGPSKIEFRYESETVHRSLQLSFVSMLVLLGLGGGGLWSRRTRST